MSSQTIIENLNPTSFGLGTSDTDRLALAYGSSPMNASEGTVDDTERMAAFIALVQTGEVKDKTDGAGVAGFQFDSFNRDFSVNMTGGLSIFDPGATTQNPGAAGGAPANAYVPNVASPGGDPEGPTNLSPDTMPAPPNVAQSSGATPFIGNAADSADAQPLATSTQIEAGTIGQYMLGKGTEMKPSA